MRPRPAWALAITLTLMLLSVLFFDPARSVRIPTSVVAAKVVASSSTWVPAPSASTAVQSAGTSTTVATTTTTTSTSTTVPPITTTSASTVPTAAPAATSWDTVTDLERSEWTRVAVCEEGGWVGSSGTAYPDSLGINATNWAANGGWNPPPGVDPETPDWQIMVAERIQSYPPDQGGCAAW